MSFFTPPPLRPKCARPTSPGFKHLNRRGVYIVMFASMIFVGLMFAGLFFLCARFLLWTVLVQMGKPYVWASWLTLIGFIVGSRIGNWSGRMVILETMKRTQQNKTI